MHGFYQGSRLDWLAWAVAVTNVTALSMGNKAISSLTIVQTKQIKSFLFCTNNVKLNYFHWLNKNRQSIKNEK